MHCRGPGPQLPRYMVGTEESLGQMHDFQQEQQLSKCCALLGPTAKSNELTEMGPVMVCYRPTRNPASE